MNFVYPDGTPSIPELTWRHGYLYFWMLVIGYLLVSSTCAFLLHRRFRKKRKEDFKNVPPAVQGLGVFRSAQPSQQQHQQQQSSLAPAPFECVSPGLSKDLHAHSQVSTCAPGGSCTSASSTQLGATPAGSGVLRVPLLATGAGAGANGGAATPARSGTA